MVNPRYFFFIRLLGRCQNIGLHGKRRGWTIVFWCWFVIYFKYQNKMRAWNGLFGFPTSLWYKAARVEKMGATRDKMAALISCPWKEKNPSNRRDKKHSANSWVFNKTSIHLYLFPSLFYLTLLQSRRGVTYGNSGFFVSHIILADLINPDLRRRAHDAHIAHPTAQAK